jgi:F-type H+-transporting ATPase subunit a
VAIELHPLEQFTIERWIPIHIGGVDASFTNSALFMCVAVAVAVGLIVLGARRGDLVPGRWQSLAEMSYEFIAGMIDDNVGHEGQEYFPFIFTLFILLLLLLVPIEVLSYFIRPFTLSIRLFANMMAGHTMLAIFAGFVTAMGIFGFVPLGVDVLLIFLELLVAVLQAYVFTILTCLYLRDAIHLH